VKNRNGVGASSGRNVIIGHLPSLDPTRVECATA
jgi:hypothetical protein